MKDLFVTSDHLIVIPFVIAESKDGDTLVEVDKKTLKETYGDALDPATVEEHEMAFKRPSFGDSVEIMGNISTNDGVNVAFNPLNIRYMTMTRLIKNWTFVDSEGKPVPANGENLRKLNSKVANFVGVLLDAKVGAF